MIYFTTANFKNDRVVVRTHADNQPDTILDCQDFDAGDGLYEQLVRYAKDHPLECRIRLNPAELAFRNLKMPDTFQGNLKRIARLNRNQYFPLCPDSLIIDIHPWKKEADGVWVTLLAAPDRLLNPYRPFVRAGFIPKIFVTNFNIPLDGLVCVEERLKDRVFLSVYWCRSLIAWIEGTAKEKNEIKQRVMAYLGSLGLTNGDPVWMAQGEVKRTSKSFDLLSPADREFIFGKIKARTWSFLRAAAAVFVFAWLGYALLRAGLAWQAASRLSSVVVSLKKEYGVTRQLVGVKRKKNKNVLPRIKLTSTLNRIAEQVQKASRGVQGHKIRRLQYANGRIVLTVRAADLMQMNRLIRALENEPLFGSVKMEGGRRGNDKQLSFIVKR